MLQIIKLFKSENDFFADKEIQVRILENANEEYADTFANEFAKGVAWGMRIKYARPVAAVYEVDDYGNEKLTKMWIAR